MIILNTIITALENSFWNTDSNFNTGIKDLDSLKININLSVKEWQMIYASKRIHNIYNQNVSKIEKYVSRHYKILITNKLKNVVYL